MAELSEVQVQKELNSFNAEIEEINEQLQIAYGKLNREKEIYKKIGTLVSDEAKKEVLGLEMQLKEIECKKKFIAERKISRDMLEESDKKFDKELCELIKSLAESVVSDKLAGKDITDHEFYKLKSFFTLFGLIGNFGYEYTGEQEEVKVWSKSRNCYVYETRYERKPMDLIKLRKLEISASDLPKEVFSLASKEQMENIVYVKHFFDAVPSLICFGDKLQYLSEDVLERRYLYADDGKKQFKEIAKSNIAFPPDSPIYKFLTETIPDMEMQRKQEMGEDCCEIC